MSNPVRELLAWIPALIAAGDHLLAQGVAIAVIAGWVAAANFWLGMSTETALLSFVAFAICVVVAKQNQRVLEPQLPPERDFYVVTFDQYRWNPSRNGVRPNAIKSELGGTIHAYDTLVAARIKYRLLEAEKSLISLEGRDLSYHEIFGYDEEETRLWIVYARSKTEAYDKVFYDDNRNHLGSNGRTDDLLLSTNNERRRKQYLDWWGPLHRAKLNAEHGPV